MKWPKLLSILLAMVAGWIAFNYFHRPGLDAYVAHQLPPAGETKGLRATWFGTASVLLEDGDSALFLDPFLTRPEGWLPMLANQRIAPDEPTIARTLAAAGVKKLDAVLVSHSHHDHGMDAGVVARLTGATLAGSASTLNIGRGSGVPESQLRLAKPGEAMRFGAYTVSFFASEHAGATGGFPTGEIPQPLRTPARYTDYKQGGSYSILIEHPFGNLVFHGSAGFVPDMLKGRRADAVLLGIAFADDYERYLRETVDAVGATRVMPIHWDDFTRPLQQPLRPSLIGVNLPQFFAELARLRPGLRMQTLPLGQPVLLFPRQ